MLCLCNLVINEWVSVVGLLDWSRVGMLCMLSWLGLSVVIWKLRLVSVLVCFLIVVILSGLVEKMVGISKVWVVIW